VLGLQKGGTEAFRNKAGYNVLNIKNWNHFKNAVWFFRSVARGDGVLIVSDPTATKILMRQVGKRSVFIEQEMSALESVMHLITEFSAK
jgi:hypothetical protein